MPHIDSMADCAHKMTTMETSVICSTLQICFTTSGQTVLAAASADENFSKQSFQFSDCLVKKLSAKLCTALSGQLPLESLVVNSCNPAPCQPNTVDIKTMCNFQGELEIDCFCRPPILASRSSACMPMIAWHWEARKGVDQALATTLCLLFGLVIKRSSPTVHTLSTSQFTTATQQGNMAQCCHTAMNRWSNLWLHSQSF